MAKNSKGHPMKSPNGAITTMAEVKQLLERAKERDVRVYHCDKADGTYLVRTVTAKSLFDRDGLHYFNRKGNLCRSGLDFISAKNWALFTNWWFLYAWSLKSKLPLREIQL